LKLMTMAPGLRQTNAMAHYTLGFFAYTLVLVKSK
jgi:hypothetical protein